MNEHTEHLRAWFIKGCAPSSGGTKGGTQGF